MSNLMAPRPGGNNEVEMTPSFKPQPIPQQYMHGLSSSSAPFGESQLQFNVPLRLNNPVLQPAIPQSQ